MNSNEIKVLIGPSSFAELDKTPLNRLKDAGYCIINNPYKRKLTKPELFELFGDEVTGLIAGLETLDREVMEGSSLKVISRCGSGLSNVDMEAAEELGVKVLYTPQGPVVAVAELTLCAMLSLLRMVPLMDRDLHQGKWSKRVGRQLKGKTVAIVGFGRIGRKVASLLAPFSVRILAVDLLEDPFIEGVTFCNLSEALQEADIITIHSSGESCLLDKTHLDLIKPGAYVLNAARGGVIDEEALAAKLDEGVVAGVWLDTFSQEPYSGPLTKHKKALLTPHVGSYTLEGRLNMEMEAVENLIKGFTMLKG